MSARQKNVNIISESSVLQEDLGIQFPNPPVFFVKHRETVSQKNGYKWKSAVRVEEINKKYWA